MIVRRREYGPSPTLSPLVCYPFSGVQVLDLRLLRSLLYFLRHIVAEPPGIQLFSVSKHLQAAQALHTWTQDCSARRVLTRLEKPDFSARKNSSRRVRTPTDAAPTQMILTNRVCIAKLTHINYSARTRTPAAHRLSYTASTRRPHHRRSRRRPPPPLQQLPRRPPAAT